MSQNEKSVPLAIVGIGCVFPEGEDFARVLGQRQEQGGRDPGRSRVALESRGLFRQGPEEARPRVRLQGRILGRLRFRLLRIRSRPEYAGSDGSRAAVRSSPRRWLSPMPGIPWTKKAGAGGGGCRRTSACSRLRRALGNAARRAPSPAAGLGTSLVGRSSTSPKASSAAALPADSTCAANYPGLPATASGLHRQPRFQPRHAAQPASWMTPQCGSS